ncbi:MAG: amidohydrolase family protein [Erysipelotrichaceae bacterium]|nr:amidohydrolase family protein [Erysipelotrichaceae bacterium]
MLIKNARVFIDGSFHDLDVRFDEKGITEIGKDLADNEIIDAEGNELYAGIIDAHCHGGFLRSFGYEKRTAFNGSRDEQVRFLSEKLPETGVTTVFPTLAMDLSNFQEEKEAVLHIRSMRKNLKGADLMKFHFEGTYLTLDRYIEEGGEYPLPTKEHSDWLVSGDYSDVGFICVAPEMPGALEWLDYVSSKGVIPEIGYTKASAETVIEAADHGLGTCSHIFNGYVPMHHRDSSAVAGIMLDDRIKAQITMDGYHVAPAWVKLVIKAKGIENCYGITDLSSVSGLPDGENVLPDGTVVVTKEGFNWRTDGHILSGNNTMDRIMYRAHNAVGLTREEVGTLFAENPAKCLKIYDRGKIEVGRKSDFVIMDKDYNVIKTIINGKVFYQK